MTVIASLCNSIGNEVRRQECEGPSLTFDNLPGGSYSRVNLKVGDVQIAWLRVEMVVQDGGSIRFEDISALLALH